MTRPDGTVVWRVLEGTFGNQTSYSMRVREGVENDTVQAHWFYADGERLYERLVIDGSTRYYVPREMLSPGANYPEDLLGHPTQRHQLYVVLSGTRPVLVERPTGNGIELFRLAESDRVNADFLAAWEFVSDLHGFEFDALVTPSGLVQKYRISYVATIRDERRRVVRTARLTDVGSATVSPPDWYGTARQRTGQ